MSKPPSKTKSKVKSLTWPLPGIAQATVFFRTPRQFVGLQVMLLPGYETDFVRQAFYGDAAVADDFMNVDDFERVFPTLPEEPQFVRVHLTNLSQTDVEFNLAFQFAAFDPSIQLFPFKVAATDTVSARIPVVFPA